MMEIARASIGYTLPGGWRSARLSVCDVAGRLVRRLDPASGTRGFVMVNWDGTAGSGERVASGVYFVQLEVDGAVATERMVLLRGAERLVRDWPSDARQPTDRACSRRTWPSRRLHRGPSPATHPPRQP
jgi:hypothetical protein